MPRQESFLAVKYGEGTVEVLMTYDQMFACEAFRNIGNEAMAHLAISLLPETICEEKDIPKPGDDGYEEFTWDVMVDDAREDWKTFSYFVRRLKGHETEELFLPEDWPTAEAYVRLMGLPVAATFLSPASVLELP